MKQEIVTVKGRVIIENKSLFVRNLKNDFWDTVVGRLILPVVALIVIVTRFIYAESSFDYFMAAFWLVILIHYIFPLYDFLIKRSFAHRVPLNRIRSYEVKPDEHGLETNIILHLKNGRYRCIPFRTLEKQYEPFIESISQYIAQPQPA